MQPQRGVEVGWKWTEKGRQKERTTEQRHLCELGKNRWESQPTVLNLLVFCCRKRWSCNFQMKHQGSNKARCLSLLSYSSTSISPRADSILTASKGYLTTPEHLQPAMTNQTFWGGQKERIERLPQGKRWQKRDQSPRSNNTVGCRWQFCCCWQQSESRTARSKRHLFNYAVKMCSSLTVRGFTKCCLCKHS